MLLQRFRHYFGLHYIFFLYCLVISGLLIGLLAGYDKKYTVYVVGLYALPLGLTYFVGSALLQYFFRRQGVLPGDNYIRYIRQSATPQFVANGLFLLITGVFVVHGVLLGGYPGFRAFSEFDYNTLVNLRKGVTEDVPPLFNYLYSFTIRGFIPFSLVFAYYHRRQRHLAAFFVLALLFAFNGMQKSHFLTFFLPLGLLLLCEKKYLQGLAFLITIPACILLTVFITNPALKYSVASRFINVEHSLENHPEEQKALEEMNKISVEEANQAAASSIMERTVYLPGQMVGKWFEAIPRKKPFLHGQGYRIYARCTGQPFHDYSTEMYSMLYPEYAQRGYSGSVNVASFMYDYANFGLPGLLLSACVMGLLLLLVNQTFAGDVPMKIAFNTMPVLMLSSTSFTTLLFSGGWGLLVILFVLLLKKEAGHEKN